MLKNAIRKGYLLVHEAAVEGSKVVDEELPMDKSPMRVRHCIDLLRQSLMCQADTTVEVKDEEVGGVHGFGIEHQYREWKELVAWTAEQQGRGRGWKS